MNESVSAEVNGFAYRIDDDDGDDDVGASRTIRFSKDMHRIYNDTFWFYLIAF